MTKESNMTEEVQDQELHDEVTDEVVEQKELAPKGMKTGHDPKNAEAQSVDATDKAGDATGSAPKRKMAGGSASDNTTQDPMPKTKNGMITAMVGKMQAMTKPQMMSMYANYNKAMEGVEVEDESVISEKEDIKVSVDFSEDLNALVESEATLSDEFKGKAETIFEAAIKSKLSDEIDRLEEKYEEELSEEIASTKSDLVEKVDNYLNYVVEQWMEDNKLAVQTGLRTEIAETFMNSLKDLFTESYIEVPESKVDLVDELAGQVEELEAASNDAITKQMEMQEELETLKREKVIAEASEGLAATQVEKLKKLAEDVDFESEETFAEKVKTIKESYFTKKTTESADIEEAADDGDTIVEASGAMAQYLSAIQKTNK
tara:strand:+ start:306 stop:1430 length:1125 start_codon:yes stop_codon:yes gene_type:complete